MGKRHSWAKNYADGQFSGMWSLLVGTVVGGTVGLVSAGRYAWPRWAHAAYAVVRYGMPAAYGLLGGVGGAVGGLCVGGVVGYVPRPARA